MNVASQVHNESGDQQSITLSVVLVDADEKARAKFQSDASDLVNGEPKLSSRAAGWRI